MSDAPASQDAAAARLAQMPRVAPAWLALREPADAMARTTELVDALRDRVTGGAGGPLVVHDFGCGTGSMGRWLAPQLPGPQHWIMYDRDPDLLDQARADMVETAADGAPVTVETRTHDVTRLTAADLAATNRAADRAGATLVTASALLDLLTVEEVERIAAACAGAGCPALLTLSVSGQVELTPPDGFDAEIAAAFNAHQRRSVAGRRLLGPDAVEAAVAAFDRLGVITRVRPSPWLLGDHNPELTAEWFTGWVDAAREQRPELADAMTGYTARRRAELAAGRLAAVVGHDDLLAGI
jgi:hypothetical protein